MERLHDLTEEAALSAVLATITRLFPAVPKHLVRDLASAVLRDLAGRGIVLATRQGDHGYG
jgi:hypothetical protein